MKTTDVNILFHSEKQWISGLRAGCRQNDDMEKRESGAQRRVAET